MAHLCTADLWKEVEGGCLATVSELSLIFTSLMSKRDLPFISPHKSMGNNDACLMFVFRAIVNASVLKPLSGGSV